MEKGNTIRSTVFNMPIDTFDLNLLGDVIPPLLERDEASHIIFLDFKELIKYRLRKKYRAAINEATLIIPTSYVITDAIRFLTKRQCSPISPFEFIIRLLDVLEKKQESVYFLGGTVQSIQRVEKKIRTSYSQLRIVGRHAAQYSKERERDVILAIKKAEPGLLLCGERLKQGLLWPHNHSEMFQPKLTLWEKNFFGVITGKKKKLPKSRFSRAVKLFFITLLTPWLLPFRIIKVTWFYSGLLIDKTGIRRSRC